MVALTGNPRPYPAYKPSGVPWLGDVPAHWEVGHLRRFANCLDGTRVPLSAVERDTMQGSIPYWGANNIIDYVNDWLFDEPLVLLGEDGAPFFESNRDVSFFTSGKVWVNNHIHVLRCGRLLNPQFLPHVLNRVDYTNFISGSTRDKLTQQSMGDIPLQIPPLAEQAAIVRYLDHADRRIRRYLSAKQKLIALLQEEKQAIISQAVTRGLDPNVPLKPSGVEWLGDVPEHWGVAAAKTRYAIQLGKMLQNAPNNGYEIEVPYIKAQHVQWFQVLTADIPTMWASYAEISKFGVKPGDLLVCEGGEGGRTALLHEPIDVCIIQNALHRVRPREQDLNTFLQYVMSAVALSGWFDALNNKATIAHFTRAKFSALMIPTPPLAEQTAIVDYLDKATADIDAAIGRARRQIELLREYRTRLIADVVTGKLDVRAAAAQLPEQPDDQEPVDEGDPTEDVDGDLEEAVQLPEEPDELGQTI